MTPERLANLKAKITNARLDWKLAAGDEPCDLLDANAELIAEIERLTAVVTDPTFTRANPRAGVSVTTPPTPDLAALEQWARETAKAQPYTVWASRADAILALIASWREGQEAAQERDAAGQTLCEAHPHMWTGDRRLPQVAKDFVAEYQRVLIELDAARAERDTVLVRVDQLQRSLDLHVDVAAQAGVLREERDDARAEVARLTAERDTLPALPEGWQLRVDRFGRVAFERCEDWLCVHATISGVLLAERWLLSPTSDLITVLRHAHAAQQRLAQATPAQEGQ